MERLDDIAVTAFFVLGSLYFIKALGVVPTVIAFFVQ